MCQLKHEEMIHDSTSPCSGYKLLSCFDLDQAGEFMSDEMLRVFNKHGRRQNHDVEWARPREFRKRVERQDYYIKHKKGEESRRGGAEL